MEMTVQIPFRQLIALVRTLTPAQKAILKKELDKSAAPSVPKQDEFIDFLLKGPVYTDADIAIIEENHKSIAAWRTKH